MKKNILSIFVLVFGILISSVIIGSANAQTGTNTTGQKQLQPQEQKMPGDIQYPISELGNCKSKSDCKVFCDNAKNTDTCLSFAEKHKLMSPEELSNAKKFADGGMVGPGGCQGQAACDTYCNNSDHMEACIAFAEANGIMPEQQLQESKKVLAAIKSGIKPPACHGQQECDTYCSNPDHMEECLAFSLAAGIAPDDQKEQMQKTLDAIKQGIKPPACHGQQECDKYCSDGAHMEECITFSLATGQAPADQKEQMQKTLDAIKKGVIPPACRGQQECDKYCSDPSHVEECVKFSVAMGNMTEEQAQMSIKTGNKGPGGCIGKEACDAFCQNPDNQEICFNFGKDNGMIPQQDLQKMQEGQQKMKDAFNQIPAEVLTCITNSVGADIVDKIKSGSFIPSKTSEAMNQCFKQNIPQDKMPNGQNPQDQGQLNQNGQNQQPGGGPNQGQGYNPGSGVNGNGLGFGEGNQSMQNQNSQMQPGQAEQKMSFVGPGGCKGPEECQSYCSSHLEECQNFVPPQMQNGELNKNLIPPQIQMNQKNQQNQPGQPAGGPNQGQGYNPGSGVNGNGNGPGGGQFDHSGQQMQPSQPMQPQFQQQPPTQQNPPSEPSSFLQGVGALMANVLSAF